MALPTQLEAQLARLNEEQRHAAETLDGPLLVIAGPGTGKTQLLSVRAANILENRDVSPENILCLTYTDAGSQAMKKRLVELVGRPGYGIEVFTFHAFANRLKNLYPEYFTRDALATLATDLQRYEILNGLLEALPPSNPLFAARRNGLKSNLSQVVSAIDNLKRMGIPPEELRGIARQNLDSIAWLEQNEVYTRYLSQRIPGKQAEKEEFIRGFEEAVARIGVLAPEELLDTVVEVPGIYEPYLRRLQRLVASTELIDGKKTTGYQAVKNALFSSKKDANKQFVFKEKAASARAFELADVYAAYRSALFERDLFDYQDMVNQTVEALEAHPEFVQELQERYRYIQVDEFQDTNGSQMRIVSLLCRGLDRPNVMAVGDDDQAIMRFQGASVEGIRQFRENYRPASVVLKTNYRSTPSIVELGQLVARQIEDRLVAGSAKIITAAREEDERETFVLHRFDDASIQYDTVAASIREKLDEGFVLGVQKPEEAIAVIANRHSSLRKLIPHLVAYDVPFNYRVRAQLTEIESMQTLFSLLRAVCALAEGDVARTEAELPRIVASPELGLESEDCVAFAIEARRSHKGWFACLADAHHPKLVNLHGHLVDWAAQASSAPVRALLFDIARPLIAYYRKHAEDDPLAQAQFQSGMRRLVDLANSEIAASARERRALRLPELMRVFTRCENFSVEIDASVPFGSPDAVTLTTAHGSKGLEFDLVYILDADQATWHHSGRDTNLLPKNILTGTERSEDDITRLLFVAVTRAKRFLVFTSAHPLIVSELDGLVAELDEAVSPDQLANAIETDWRDRLSVNTPQLVQLLQAGAAPKHLSATDLNAFVTYEQGCKNSEHFPMKRLLNVPEEPSSALEFGTLVHAFLEDFATITLPTGAAVEPLLEHYLEKVRWLDFPPEDVLLMERRLRRIAASFTPRLSEILRPGAQFEVAVNGVTSGGVPLFGKCDVLLVDHGSKTVRVLDYKTGQPRERVDAAYNRQLDFYTLLVENSPDYEGYRVVETRDLFVEPRNRTEDELGNPLSHTTSPEDAEHLMQLIGAVWWRISTGRFDTSAFEKSEEYLKLMESPRTTKAAIQRLYEDWLIEDWLIACM